MDAMWTALAALGGLSLYILPGAWIAFSAGRRLTLRARFALAVALSPLVVIAGYMLLRAAGLSFATSSAVLPLIYLPGAALVAVAVARTKFPPTRAVAGWLLTLTMLVGFLLGFMGDVQVRGNHGHAWLHADIVYMVADADVAPEEPQLAGRPLAYPWLGHIYQAVISHQLDSAPNSSYLLTNLVWLLAVVALMAELVARCGGRRRAQQAAAVLLAFGVNAVGSTARLLAPADLRHLGIWGDMRYTPWLRKFGIFEPTVFGIGLFVAVAFVATLRDTDLARTAYMLLLAALIISAALLYPVLLPAALAPPAAALIVTFIDRRSNGARIIGPATLALVGIIVLGGATVALYVAALTGDRASGPAVVLALHHAPFRLVTAAIVLAPLLAGMLFAPRPWLRGRQSVPLLLMLALVPILAVFLVIDIRFWSNEYKYIYAAAVCLTPLAAIGADRLLARAGRVALPLSLLAALMLMAPAVYRLHLAASVDAYRPHINTAQFEFRMGAGEPFAALTDAIRRESPQRAVLVARTVPFDWVAPTRRATYVAFGNRTVHGLGLHADELLKTVRGHDPRLVDSRRVTVLQLFDATTAEDRALAARSILDEVRRPLVIIAMAEDAGLTAWLGSQPSARRLHADRYAATWLLIDAPH